MDFPEAATTGKTWDSSRRVRAKPYVVGGAGNPACTRFAGTPRELGDAACAQRTTSRRNCKSIRRLNRKYACNSTRTGTSQWSRPIHTFSPAMSFWLFMACSSRPHPLLRRTSRHGSGSVWKKQSSTADRPLAQGASEGRRPGRSPSPWQRPRCSTQVVDPIGSLRLLVEMIRHPQQTPRQWARRLARQGIRLRTPEIQVVLGIP
jgi:hypothetical protein